MNVFATGSSWYNTGGTNATGSGLMTYRGHVRNGVVLLDDNVRLPDDSEVRVELVQAGGDTPEDETGPTLFEQLRPLAGAAKGLPPDLAQNHDHYLHGQPKR
jgi:hypothetical protein